MNKLMPLLVLAALLSACSLEIQGDGWENEAPADFAGYQFSSSSGGTEFVTLPQGVLAWCHRLRGDGDDSVSMTWTERTGSFAEGMAPFTVDETGLGNIDSYQAIEVAEGGEFLLEVESSGAQWDAAVTLPVNECPWEEGEG